ncbi:hypothetical protein [Burkholderia sp. Bp9142]|uniref:hypothetical protein n=1 Tax=Burkholderia sp. Bp9142 TaxID=2184573 RepID=UPI000F59BA11|nr:hypothetical protein [Burkholderia sp. Bp9142]RQR27298.1 hypothetical protein DIE22_30960 [Burkholderia sp. Bp9142]
MTRQEVTPTARTTEFPFVGSNEPALLKILRAAVAANPLMLDRPLFCSADYSVFLEFLADRPMASHYLDVPLRAFVGTQHLNFDPDARTWRHGLTALTGEDKDGGKWDDRALAYFESEIGDQRFPCDAASGTALQLAAWNGAVFSDNGAHRLIAAVCWLAARKGSEAELRKVRVSHRTLNHEAVELLAKAAAAGWEIAEGRHGSGWLIRVTEPRRASYFFVQRVGAGPKHVKRSELDAICGGRSLPGDTSSDDWLGLKPFPAELALALADGAWLQKQLAAPRY